MLHFDDRFHSVGKICLENGLGYENHNITTEDGYILRLDRVLPTNTTKSDYNKGAKRPVVLLQHGISDSSITWVINSPDKAVAFQLIKAGFDVWMGNNRGNEYSKTHVTFNNTQKEYWDGVDFELMGTRDQPAQIDFITKKIGVDKIDAYVGHSEGTTQFFIGSTMLPEYYKKHIPLFVALAPVVRLDHTTN